MIKEFEVVMEKETKSIDNSKECFEKIAYNNAVKLVDEMSSAGFAADNRQKAIEEQKTIFLKLLTKSALVNAI